MRESSNGFLYPFVELEKCTRCGRCVESCHVVKKKELTLSPLKEPLAFAAKNLDKSILGLSSSGGVFTALAASVLRGLGAVYGAAFNDRFELEHIRITSESELGKLRGSKYLQSRISASYSRIHDDLANGLKILFVGTPCQTGGLLHFLGKDHHNLLLVDLICHGVPSPKLWRNYKEYQEKKYRSRLSAVNFREKSAGWRSFEVAFKFQNGKEVRKPYRNDIYYSLFLANVGLRSSCHTCIYKSIKRNSDITLGDFWGIEHVHPEVENRYGVSAVIVHSSKGMESIRMIEGSLSMKETCVDAIVKYNSSAIHSAVRPSLERSRALVLEASAFDACAFKSILRRIHWNTNMLRLRRKLSRVLLFSHGGCGFLKGNS